MSGDVQPRKRKDKKRKKDETSEQIPIQPQTPIITNINEDQNIHIHKEEGTGGGICAKIVFFVLFTALAVCIGLIITEHRGLTDLEEAESESRFAQIFEGWIDKHDDHDHEEEHSYLPEDHDDVDDDHAASEETEDANISEEIDDHEQDEDESQITESDENLDDDEEEEEDNVDEDEEEANTQEVSDEKEEDEEEEEEEEEEANTQEVSDEKEEEEEEEEEEEDNEDESIYDNELTENDEINENEEASRESDIEENGNDMALEESEEDVDVSEEKEENIIDDDLEELRNEIDDDQEEDNDNDDEDEKQADVLPDEENEDPSKEEIEDDANENKENEEPDTISRMAVKIGVGLALLVVAHIVLVKKWKSANADTSESNESPIILSRRNTIVVPPSLHEVEHALEENEGRSKIRNGSDVENIPLKQNYQELRTTYTRSLTPENESIMMNLKYTNDHKNNEYEDEESGEYEDDEEDMEDEGAEEEEEEEEEAEDDGDENEEIEEEEEDEEEVEGSDYEPDEDDEELMKRLEAKYGVNVSADNEIEESDSDKQSDDIEYEYENMTNKEDWKIKDDIDEAHKAIDNNAAYALKLFDVLVKKYPSSPRSLFGKAKALDELAEAKKSNELLLQAINTYLLVVNLHDTPDALFQLAADRCINRMRFLGQYSSSIGVHMKLIKRFPNHPKYKCDLAVTYLILNKIKEAKEILKKTLEMDPENGFALVHYGFILKTADNNLVESVEYMKKGIATKDPGVVDGRFYFHLGDALTRLGKPEEAMKIYKEAVQYKLFLSAYQRSLYNVNRLKAKPWWTQQETPYKELYTSLENNWKQIREEGLALLNKDGYFLNESENLKHTGDWKQFELFARGQKNIKNCNKCPFTCKLIENIPDARGCRRGQTKFSVMHPGTHVWPHCGPTNCRLRVHLGLEVPENTYIRVADEIRSWENGKVLIFDDSFEHEVWHNGTTYRLVLIVDVWHPELTFNEKKILSPI